ncbi:MAG: DUF1840 domain-containing protein [Variovorax sp.]
MLYRFKSQATADVVMLEATGRQMLDIIGKAASAKGIVTVEQLPTAIHALETAVRAETGDNPHNADAFATEGHAEEAERQHVGLHQRAAPLIDMFKRSLADKEDVVWGV